MHDYELEKLDVKIMFFHGDLEEDIYMDRSEGFIIWLETISNIVI
jgi:hypothetical protein